MKKQILSAVLFSATLAFTACQKSEAGDPIDSFRAFSEASTSAKTHLEPDVENHAFRVLWDQGDEIKVYNNGAEYGFYATQQGDVEAATFRYVSGNLSAGRTYTAFYPATIATSYNYGTPKVTIPALQTYQAVQQDADGGYYGYVKGFPMAAQSTYSNPDFYFKNLCGLCVLRLKGRSGTEVMSITLSEPTYPYTTATALSGSFTVNWGSDGLPSLRKTATAAGQENVSLAGSSVTLGAGYHLFYFYLPEGDHKWLNVQVNYCTRENGYIVSGSYRKITRTILASTYGAENISFTRSRWTALDVDLSNCITLDGDMMDDIHQYRHDSEGEDLIYAADNLTFGPNSDNEPILNTNHRIADEPDSYTILIDAIPSELDANEVGVTPRYYTLYNDMDATSSESNGIIIRYRKAYGEPLSINVEGPHASDYDKLVIHNSDSDDGITVAAGISNRIAVVIDLDNSRYHLYANSSQNRRDWSEISHISGEMLNWLAQDEIGFVRAVVGGDQSDVTGGNTEVNQLKHNFQGTIRSIRIYNRVISDRELQRWHEYGSLSSRQTTNH